MIYFNDLMIYFNYTDTSVPSCVALMPIIFAQLCVVDYFRVVYTDVKPCVTLETATDATKSRLMSCVAIAGRKLSTRLFLVVIHLTRFNFVTSSQRLIDFTVLI